MRSTLRGSWLVLISVLCVAVFCSHTAHAAKTASHPFRMTPCRVKVASAPPTAEIRLEAGARRAQRTPQRALLWHAGMARVPVAGPLAAENSLRALRARQILLRPGHTRTFVLRL